MTPQEQAHLRALEERVLRLERGMFDRTNFLYLGNANGQASGIVVPSPNPGTETARLEWNPGYATVDDGSIDTAAVGWRVMSAPNATPRMLLDDAMWQLDFALTLSGTITGTVFTIVDTDAANVPCTKVIIVKNGLVLKPSEYTLSGDGYTVTLSQTPQAGSVWAAIGVRRAAR